MSSWQDIVIAAGSLVFAVALIPSVLSKDKPALSTSVMTGGVLAVFSITYATLTLWYAAITTSLAAALWIALAVQKNRQRKTAAHLDK